LNNCVWCSVILINNIYVELMAELAKIEIE
jgi:hypothetical protein